ncbi:PAS domain-containing sensor histidine kinase [Ferruginibacter sp. HRS2-29]|uniref:sensor histidine kinase n=1 Tax=Ferruginibacter sp. HRS2-29 TaxID=2487334 RepID=UPI0020CCA14B|nr:HAMP domain-containing sensor histidine kinase [Ferruginibacter sp. HRS2-29]MCP9752248.1 sensor histidine kinase [Ferruginibacter sp. HRS2-29]
MPLLSNYPRFLKDNLYLLLVAAMLFTISFVSDNYWSVNYNLSSETKRMNEYVIGHEKDFKKLLTDKEIFFKIRNEKSDEESLGKLISQKYFVFFYKKDPAGIPVLRYWNTQYILPGPDILQSPAKAGFATLPNGYYVWNKTDSAGIISIALIPVKWNYIITNEYLENTFLSDENSNNKYAVEEGAAAKGNVYSSNGTVLFHLKQIYSGSSFQNNHLSLVCRILGVLFIFFFLHVCASYLVVRTRFVYACIFLFGSMLFLRVISYLFHVPMNFRQFELFDPAVYGSNFILKSLGDLLINAVLFLWFVIFVRFHLHEKNLRISIKNEYSKWVMTGVGTLIILLATFTGSTIIRSLVADSQISFDVINFFSLNFYTVISFLILSAIAIAYFFLCQIILFLLKPHFKKPFITLFLSVTIMALFLLSFKIGDISGGFELYVLVWLLIFLFLLNFDYFYLIASKIVTSKLVFWIFFFSVSISAIIIKENNSKEIRNRQHYAEILATKSNPTSETLLNTMLTDFRADYLADNFYRFTEPQDNHFFKDSLINNNFAGYTDKYDTKIFTFDNKELPLYNVEENNYNDLNTILNTQAKPTGIQGLMYYDQAYDKFSYIIKKTIVDTSRTLIGYVFILVNPKYVKNETLSPELFGKGHNNALENSSAYAFAIYNNGRLVSSHNDYPFATRYTDQYYAGKQYLMINRNGHSEMWYNAGGSKHVVIAKEDSLSIESLTLFSYLFCSFLLLTAMAWFLDVMLRSRFKLRNISNYWQLSIRNQIHGTIIFFSVVSFFVIGIATIVFFINRYESNNREKLSSTIRIMEKEVRNSFSAEVLKNDTLAMAEQGNQQAIENNINRISEIHGVDVNLYTLNGDLRVSSLPLPYIKGIVSTKMEPQAFYHLSNQKEVQYFQKEHIGKLSFLSSYVPVLDSAGNAYAYLNVPYFTSQSKLRDEISNFLVTIINLNAFIFLIAGIVALFITNRITNTFSLIGEKMKKINLGKRNEAIEWHRSDEIGDLVNEYNKMVSKLDESAQALAKTEREGAWREMARQVAHEIKNPLTPMKLSMQFLQKSIENNAPNVKELSASVANTLVEQIDHLSNIANEFSQFANIENAKMVRIDLNDSIRSIKQLYSGNADVTFDWNIEEKPVYVFADRTHINRLFTNLIQNGLQAMPEGRLPHITITEETDETSVLVKVKDNGTGIDPAMQSKIFTPNFTTKSSGTGLGLAMCRRIVEQTNGTIYFETSADEGTTFFIRFPLAEV